MNTEFGMTLFRRGFSEPRHGLEILVGAKSDTGRRGFTKVWISDTGNMSTRVNRMWVNIEETHIRSTSGENRFDALHSTLDNKRAVLS